MDGIFNEPVIIRVQKLSRILSSYDPSELSVEARLAIVSTIACIAQDYPLVRQEAHNSEKAMVSLNSRLNALQEQFYNLASDVVSYIITKFPDYHITLVTSDTSGSEFESGSKSKHQSKSKSETTAEPGSGSGSGSGSDSKSNSNSEAEPGSGSGSGSEAESEAEPEAEAESESDLDSNSEDPSNTKSPSKSPPKSRFKLSSSFESKPNPNSNSKTNPDSNSNSNSNSHSHSSSDSDADIDSDVSSSDNDKQANCSTQNVNLPVKRYKPHHNWRNRPGFTNWSFKHMQVLEEAVSKVGVGRWAVISKLYGKRLGNRTTLGRIILYL